jgi:hypothetical protein
MGKHYVVDDQEYERFRTSVEVDEHVLRDLYLLPFEMLVKDGRIATIMSADNRVRGVYATEYRWTLTDNPSHGVGFRRLRPVRLLVLPLLRSVAQGRNGPGDDRRQMVERGECDGGSA